MGHCLTQPEEIDHILMAMSNHDVEAEPILDGMQSGSAIRDIGRDEPAVPDFP